MKKILIAAVLLLVLILPLSALANTSVTLDSNYTPAGNGQVTISWTASEKPAGGYNVIVGALSPDGSDPVLQSAGSTSGTSITTGLLAPGNKYRVYVVDSSFNILGLGEYSIPDVPPFEDGLLKDTSIKVSFEQRTTNLSTYRKVNSFRASDMLAGIQSGSQYPCLKYQMQMPQLAYERAFFVQLVFVTPDGAAFTDRAQDVTFQRVNNGYQTLWWENAGIDFFDKLNSQRGDIPSGEYTVHLYWDGYWVKTSTFTVY